jgi:uncharacterized protein YggU (UPF0235/DUF167 family)
VPGAIVILRISPSRVAVVRGQTSRDKILRVEGVAQDELRAALVRQCAD